jgi:tetratricopeptide (TPR) repeat protein
MKPRYQAQQLDLERLNRAHLERLNDIEKGILACCHALQRLRHDDPRVPQYALEMAIYLIRRSESVGDSADIEHAANLCRWGLSHGCLSPHLHASLLDELGEAVRLLWASDRCKSHLDESLQFHLESSAIRKAHHLEETYNMFCIANSKRNLAYVSSDPSPEFHESLDLYKRAADAASNVETQARCLEAISETILIMYDRVRNNYLEEGVVAIDEAISLTPQEDAAYSWRLTGLGMLLWRAFQARSMHTSMNDLEAALKALQDACKIAVTISPRCYRYSHHILGWVWLTSFEQTGILDHLDEAVKLAREDFLTEKTGSANRIVAIRKLQLCLRRRYERLGILEDLDQSIELGRMALNISPPGDFEWPTNLCYLASGLLQRYIRSHDLQDLTEAIDMCQESIFESDAMRNSTDYCNCLRALGEAYLRHASDVSRSHGELSKAISTLRESFAVVAEDEKIGRIEIVDSLASGLRVHAEWTKCTPSLEEAISLRRECLVDVPDVRPDYAHMQALLADDLFALYELANRPEDLQLSLSTYRSAIQNPYGNPRDSLNSGKRWIDVASRCKDPSFLSRAYRDTIGLLPRLAYSGYSPTTRLQFLRDTPGLAVEAANHALALSNSHESVELLEHGRSVLWSRALQHRHHFRDLPLSFSSQLNTITKELQKPIGEKLAGIMTSDWEMSRRRHLIDEFESILTQVRDTPGFKDYLLPKSYGVLQFAASRGPVVILLAGQAASHAIVIKAQGSVHPLPLTITNEDLKGLVDKLSDGTAMARHGSTQVVTDIDRLHLKKQKRQRDDAFIDILNRLWNEVAHPVLILLSLECQVSAS